MSMPHDLADLNPEEKALYRRFRDAFEKCEQYTWELEKKTLELKRKEVTNEARAVLETAQKDIDLKISEALAAVKILVAEAEKTMGQAKKFGRNPTGNDGLANTIQRRIEQDILENKDTAYPHILKKAILNAFMDREKTSRASIYKKRFRQGFQHSAESLIQEEQKKNAAWREEVLAAYAPLLPAEDLELLRTFFRVRMTRHGQAVT